MSAEYPKVRFGARLYDLRKPMLMAIVNATPDSFFAGSRAVDESSLRAAFSCAVDEGADIIDIGACSTRPAVQSQMSGDASSGLATEQQEWQRLSLALSVARRMDIRLPLSVDTFRPRVAQRAIEEYGVEIINDVSGGSEQMFGIVAQYNVAYVLMYNRSLASVTTDDLTADALAFFSHKVDELHRLGVSDVIVDPGFGFGQTVQQSLDLLSHMSVLQHIGCPLLAGVSRKRMAYEPDGLTPDTCLQQTLRLERLAVSQGANILRVHDVAATRSMLNGQMPND